MSNYQEYSADEKFFTDYTSYQDKYIENPRESDKVVASLVQKEVEGIDSPKILDIGCSSGNLLRVIRAAVPKSHLFGKDLSEVSINKCKKDPGLQGISFSVGDLLHLNKNQYNSITVSAVLWVLGKSEFRRAIKSCYEALVDRGSLVIFDYFHPFSCQELKIRETSIGHPKGMTYWMRPVNKVKRVFEKIGFRESEFTSFNLPLELPNPDYDGEVSTYTVKTEDRNLCFRGALYQPWCHVVARK